MNKGLHQLKLKLLNKQLSEDLPSGEQLFKRLAQVWEEFFNQILPIIECIFYRLRARTAFLPLCDRSSTCSAAVLSMAQWLAVTSHYAAIMLLYEAAAWRVVILLDAARSFRLRRIDLASRVQFGFLKIWLYEFNFVVNWMIFDEFFCREFQQLLFQRISLEVHSDSTQMTWNELIIPELNFQFINLPLGLH